MSVYQLAVISVSARVVTKFSSFKLAPQVRQHSFLTQLVYRACYTKTQPHRRSDYRAMIASRLAVVVLVWQGDKNNDYFLDNTTREKGPE